MGLLALSSSVFADVIYNVIAFPDASNTWYAVEINKKLYPLLTTEATFPLWSAKVAGVSASSSYHYVHLNSNNDVIAREKFLRHFTNKDATATPNEFFDRQTTFTPVPAIKQVYKDIRPKPSKAFDSSQIATIHLTAEPTMFDDMINNPLDKKRKAIKVGFKFINADTVYSVSEAKLSVSGNSSRKFKKVSLRIKFNDDKGETFFDRPIIKLRAEATDPTMMREKLYLDILDSVGVAAYQGSYVRVYVNGKPHGFYLMVEDIEEPFLLNTIHHGVIKDKKALGSLYQMGLGEAAMVYKGSSAVHYSPRVYANKIRGPKDKHMQQWISFMKDLQDWNPAAPGGVAYWNQRLDLDGYLRSMALEYLAGAWDASWWRGHNFFMYYNPQRKVWQFIPTDFDHTFNNGNRPDVHATYKKFGESHLSHKLTAHPLVTKLIYENKDINKLFETILFTITQDVFNSRVLDARIDAYERQIEQDVAWDYSIDRSKMPGRKIHWTIAFFHKSVKGRTGKIIRGLKPWISIRAKSVPAQIGK
ncbi:hypothetical protein BG015_004398 [Linnemannia schmuckeri]|uniref:Uncharacterized protein n=1 Tax=Linnemannia schmuckeri TaxID=64567 RepID=A0A9P5V0D5_9FUNG|nr:hypothetical protein BG015_004398 [Linnemannia schmuckeri]